MKRKYLSASLAAIAALALASTFVGQASAALMGRVGNTPFLAIYGSPGSNGAATLPVGGGLGRNFGFGENMLFRAGNGSGKPLSITLAGTVLRARDTFLGGTLMSNKTGANNPLSFAIQFVDFQDSFAGTAKDPTYSDTSDRAWITEICAPGAESCRLDPLRTVAELEKDTVEAENVSFNVGPGIVVQGTVWGFWKNGKPPCIELKPKPANATASQTLIETQGPNVGAAIAAIKGELCLISANNDWYSVKAEAEEPEEKAEVEETITNE